MGGEIEGSRRSRLAVITDVPGVSECSTSQRRTAESFRTGWIPNITNPTPHDQAVRHIDAGTRIGR